MIKRMFANWFAKSSSPASTIVPHASVPKHVAIIMDGNGRWAKAHGMPRIAGHRAGMKTVKRITIAANDMGVEALTLYAFSTENWKRPREEVEYLMRLPMEFLKLELNELIEKNVQVRMMGWEDHLPEHTLKAVNEAIERTKDNTGLVLNFALNYGSRKEILDGVKALSQEVASGKLKSEEISEAHLEQHLFTNGLPELDLMIRTSGELRISNFMLWQLAYAELWFTDVHWPDFTEDHFQQAIAEYQRRTRRYGGLTS